MFTCESVISAHKANFRRPISAESTSNTSRASDLAAHTARAVLEHMHGDQASLQPFAYSNTRAYFFSFAMPSVQAFLKVPTTGQCDVMRREARIARCASAAGIGPKTFDVPGHDHVLLSEQMGNSPLSAFQARQPAVQDKLVALLGRVNCLQVEGLSGPDKSIVATVNQTYAKATTHAQRRLLNLSDVKSFVDAQIKIYQSSPFTKKVIHADVWHDNILIDKQRQLKLIDWGAARVDDPLIDLCRFMVLADVAESEEQILFMKHLKNRSAEYHEKERFFAVLGIFEADYYCYYACADHDKPNKPTLARFAERLQRRSGGAIQTFYDCPSRYAA